MILLQAEFLLYLILSNIYSLTYHFITNSLNTLLTRFLAHSLTHSLIYSFTDLSLNPFITNSLFTH